MVTREEAIAELERRRSGVTPEAARAELARRAASQQPPQMLGSGLREEVSKIAESGIKNIASFGSTEPLYKAETALGRIAADMGRPFRPVLGAMELATAAPAALLREYVGEPVQDITGSPALGTIAEIGAAILAPSQLPKALARPPAVAPSARPPSAPASALPSLPPKALGKIGQSLRQDIPNPQDFNTALARYQSRPGVSLLESAGGETTKSLAEGASMFPSTAKITKPYFAERVAQTQAGMKKALGKAVSPVDDFYATIDDIVESGQAAAKPLYDDAFTANQTVSSPRLNKILETPAAKQALREVAETYQNKMQLLAKPDPELTGLAREVTELGLMKSQAGSGGVSGGLKLRALDAVKKQLDKSTYRLKRAADMGDAAAANQYDAYNDVRAALVDELDNLDKTGNYAKARATAGDYIRMNNAAEEGLKFLRTDPELIAREFAKKTAQEQRAYRMGAVKALRDQIDNKMDGSNVASLFNKPAMRNRIKAVTTENQFNDLLKYAKEVDELYGLRNQLTAGSRTAMRQEAAEQFKGGLGDLAVDAASTGSGLSAIINQGIRYIQKYRTGLTDKSAEDVAKILFETDPKKKALIVRQLVNASKGSGKAAEAAAAKAEAFFDLSDLIAMTKETNPMTRATVGAVALTPEEIE